MVSGFFTSPCDQLRMSSAVARPMRRSPNSFTSSTVSFLCLNLVDARSVRAAGQGDTEGLGSLVCVVFRLAHFENVAFRVEDLNVQTQRLHLFHQHAERLRQAWFGDVLSLHNRLIDLDATHDVVRLDSQQFLECVSSSISFERPHLHLTKALATKLGLTAQWLLRDHRVRTSRASVNLVVHQVVQLQEVLVAHSNRLRERLSRAAVEQTRLTRGVDQTVTI